MSDVLQTVSPRLVCTADRPDFIRAGSALFLHLLKHTSLFISLRSECYRQVSGIPVYDLMPLAVAGVKRKAEGPDGHRVTAPSKAQANQRIPLAASDELLPRSAIFYATLGKTKAASSGVSSTSEEFEHDSRTLRSSPNALLARIDVLNSVLENFPPTTSPSYARDLAPARHLSKHIWRDEYGLDLANLPRTEPHHRRQLVENAIMNKGPTGTPKRLQAVLPLLKDMTFHHRELDYRALRDKICPSTVSQPGRVFLVAAGAYRLRATTMQLHKKEFSPEEKALLLVGRMEVI